MRRGSGAGNASGMLKSGEGALLKLKPATLSKGCWVGVGDAVVEVEDVDVVGLKGESELGSARRMDDCEKAVRSFWRERAGERRRDGMFVCECVVGVCCCCCVDCECIAQVVLRSRECVLMLRGCVQKSLSVTAEVSKKYMILLLQRNR
jgi:hypothetical protein